MPLDGSGVYTLPAIYNVTPGQDILDVQLKTPLEDIRDALSLALYRDGRAALTGNLQGGGNRATGFANGIAGTDLATVNQTIANIRPTRSVTSASSAADRTLVAGDFSRTIILAGASDFTLTTESMATLGNGWSAFLRVDADVIVTIDPDASATIDGATTLTLAQGQSALLVCDGTALRTVGLQHAVVLGRSTLTTAQASVEFAIPKGFHEFQITGQHFPASDGWLLTQLSNNNGSTWSTTGYGSVRNLADSGATVAAVDATITTGLVLGRASNTGPNVFNSVYYPGNGAGENWMWSGSGSRFSTPATQVSGHGSLLTGTLANVNRIRIIMNTGNINSGSRFMLRGVR